ncbi:3-oxoacyl-[acyl-carrier-protein] synthase III C-terminal domain-containing protein [Streptomyces sp. NC-S4]
MAQGTTRGRPRPRTRLRPPVVRAPRTGNAAAATVTLQLAHAAAHDRLAPGERVALFGLAGGAGGAVVLLHW